jgi:hypothetical protein
MFVFLTQLYELLPLWRSSLWFTFPPSPVSKYSIYRQCVAGMGRWGEGCWVLLETIFFRSLTLCIWPDWEPTKLLDHSKQKTRRGRGPQTDKHLPQSPFTGKWRQFALLSNLFTQRAIATAPYSTGTFYFKKNHFLNKIIVKYCRLMHLNALCSSVNRWNSRPILSSKD